MALADRKRESRAAARARLRADMRTLVTELRLMDTTVSAIYLTGGYGRGEGGWVAHDTGTPIPWADYDILAVVASPDAPCYSRRIEVQSVVRAAMPHLPQLDLAVATLDELREMRPSIYLVDLLASRRLLWGIDVLDGVTADAAALSPIHERDVATCMRSWTLLMAASFIPTSVETGIPAARFRYYLAKVVFGVVDIWLVSLGAYATLSHNKVQQVAPHLDVSDLALVEWASACRTVPAVEELSRAEAVRMWEHVWRLFCRNTPDALPLMGASTPIAEHHRVIRAYAAGALNSPDTADDWRVAAERAIRWLPRLAPQLTVEQRGRT